MSSGLLQPRSEPSARPGAPSGDAGAPARLADLLIALNADPQTGPRIACHLARALAPELAPSPRSAPGRGNQPAPSDPLDGPPVPEPGAALALWLGLTDPAAGAVSTPGSGAPAGASPGPGRAAETARIPETRPTVDTRTTVETRTTVDTAATAESAATLLALRLGIPRVSLLRSREIAGRCGEQAAAERQRAEQTGARILTLLDPGYPPALFDLALPPPVLYVQGEIPTRLCAEGLGVAIVGARRADRYGLAAAEHFARALAGAGLSIVSGLARGVDAAAHRGALAAGGTTVGVLGCGLDVDYPRGHRKLRGEIATTGAVITEFPFGFTPRPWSFPVRNRILAALALGTLVVQATERSGSLITAGHALELGREVLAVPGTVFDRQARGPHALLRDGAALAAEPRDVLDALLGPSATDRLLRLTESAEEAAARTGGEDSAPQGQQTLRDRLLVQLVVGRGRGAEELSVTAGCGVDAALGVLLQLELEGWVRREPGPSFSRTSR